MNKIKRISFFVLSVIVIFSSLNLDIYAFNNYSKTNFKLENQIYSVEVRTLNDLRIAEVYDNFGNKVSSSVYNFETEQLFVDGSEVLFSDVENQTIMLPYGSKYIGTRERVLDISGMSGVAVVAAIAAKVGISAGAAAGVIARYVDTNFPLYISLKIHTYWDPDTINQQRPKYWEKVDVYGGKNFEHFIVRI